MKKTEKKNISSKVLDIVIQTPTKHLIFILILIYQMSNLWHRAKQFLPPMPFTPSLSSHPSRLYAFSVCTSLACQKLKLYWFCILLTKL